MRAWRRAKACWAGLELSWIAWKELNGRRLCLLLLGSVARGEVLLEVEALEPAVVEFEAGLDGREIGFRGIRFAGIDGNDEALEALVSKAKVGGDFAGGGHVDPDSCVGGEHEVAGGAARGHEACHGGGECEEALVHVWGVGWRVGYLLE